MLIILNMSDFVLDNNPKYPISVVKWEGPYYIYEYNKHKLQLRLVILYENPDSYEWYHRDKGVECNNLSVVDGLL